ncbi:MAG TPA: hypothetical protein VFE14_10660 [Micromonosporaceae bacterium]|nr:hypothetical protein [Micromonosporaceae bacterium]
MANAAAAACAFTMVSDLANAHGLFPSAPWWGLGGGATAAALAAGIGAWQYQPTRAVLYRAGCWLAAGLWSMAAIRGNPWSPRSWLALAIGTVAAGAIGLAYSRVDQRARAREQREEGHRRRLADAARRPGRRAAVHDEIAAEWTGRITRVCSIAVVVRNVELWPGEQLPGFTLDADLPEGGTTWQDLQRYQDGLAADARLPEGCAVEVGPGADRGCVLLRVGIRNALAEDKAYPRVYPHESINEPRLLAVWKDDTEVRVPMRQETALIVGPTGSGKTTTLNVVIADLLKCVDVIPCVIDFNGGGLAIPWLLAWRLDPQRCPRPPISWVADSPTKALTMTQALLELATDRKQAYASVKMAANTTLLPICADLPLFMLLIDEVAEVLGTAGQRDPTIRKVADNVLELQRIGRDSGVRLVISGLGATIETLGSRAVGIHSKVKLAMAQTPPDEMYYLFNVSKLSAEDAVYPGTAHIQLGVDPPRVGKVPNLVPDQIIEIACATSDRRPDPDQRGLQVLGERWTGRWDRCAELLARLDAGAAAVEALRRGEPISAVVGAVTPARPANPTPAPAASDDAGSLSGALADLNAARQQLNDAIDQADAPHSTPEDPASVQALEAMFQAPAIQPDRPWVAPPAAAAPHKHPRTRMRELVTEARETGITPGEVHKRLQAEGYSTVLQTVTTWMRDDAAAGIITQPGGDRTPYFPTPHGDRP